MPWSRVSFPNYTPIVLSRFRSAAHRKANQFVFKVEPKMTKHELREYLTKLYGLNVRKINTMNYDGKLKRARGQFLYRTPPYKKAVVSLNPRFEGDTFGWPEEL